MTDERTCGVIIEPFVRALGQRADLPAVQIIGGNGSAALLNEDTVIDLAAGTIEAPATCDLPRFRPDGTLRDMDTLVLTTDPERIDRVHTLAEELVGGELKISTFGLKTVADLQRLQSRPWRSTATIFLGDRYVTTPGLDGFKALHPFATPIAADALETFQLSIGGRAAMPTAHPGATILNYLTRSVSGLRAKDRAKVEAMTENVLVRCPEVWAWIHDGPGRSMLELARILHTLSEPRRDPRALWLGTKLEIVPYTLPELVEHPAFVAPTLGRRAWRTIIELSHLKSRGLARFEGNQTVVTFWQKHIEERVGRIIHNDA